jgi:hypothetical protein
LNWKSGYGSRRINPYIFASELTAEGTIIGGQIGLKSQKHVLGPNYGIAQKAILITGT